MGQRDFLLKEEKIDKLPLRAQKHFYVQHYGTHGSQQTGRSMCLVRFFLGNTAQMRWSAGEWIFRQMQMQISKVYWR